MLINSIRKITKTNVFTCRGGPLIAVKHIYFIYTVDGRAVLLKLLYNALCSIKPTAFKNERVFSLSGNFVTKNRLSDKTVRALIFLKAYFIKSAI